MSKQDKGKYFERKIAKEIAKIFGLEYNKDIIRTPNSGGLKYAKGDIQFLTEQTELPYHFECKFGYEISLVDIQKDNSKIKNFIKQTLNDCSKHKIPLLIISKPYFNIYVIVIRKYVNFNKIDKLLKLSFVMLTMKYLVFDFKDFKQIHDWGILKWQE